MSLYLLRVMKSECSDAPCVRHDYLALLPPNTTHARGVATFTKAPCRPTRRTHRGRRYIHSRLCRNGRDLSFHLARKRGMEGYANETIRLRALRSSSYLGSWCQLQNNLLQLRGIERSAVHIRTRRIRPASPVSGSVLIPVDIRGQRKRRKLGHTR